MKSIWEPVEGLAIAKFPFLAHGEKQIPMLAGDQFQVLHKTEGWFHGKNLISGLDGIFPQNYVAFYQGNNLNKNILLGKPEDLLWHEASVILRETFEKLQQINIFDSPDMVKYFNIIYDLMGDFDYLTENPDKPETFAKRHAHIAKRLDLLYGVLKHPIPKRSSSSSPITMTTWGREMFVQNMEITKTNTLPEYVLLKMRVTIKNLKKTTSFRFTLHQQSISAPFISAPISFVVTPTDQEPPFVDLLFDELDLSTCKEQMYLVIYSYDFTPTKGNPFDDRECTSCAVVELPTCRRKATFERSQKTPLIREATARVAPPDYIQNLHYEILRNEAGENIPLSYHVTWVAYQGTYQKLVDKVPDVMKCTLVPPFCLPQTVVPSEQRSILFFELIEIQQKSKRKRSRTIIRLLDTHMNPYKFCDCIENIETHELDQPEWISTTFSGTQNLRSSETFAIDLSKVESSPNELYIVIELQRSNITDTSLYSSGYAVIPLSKDGCLPQNHGHGKAQIYHWSVRDDRPRKPEDFSLKPPMKGKKPVEPVGYIEYGLSFASTRLTADHSLYDLIHYNSDNTQESTQIKQSIDEWSKIPISDWSKFVKELLMNFCIIISTRTELATDAFKCLKDIFIKILVTPTYGDHIKLLDEFVKHDFPEEVNKADSKLTDFYQTVISNIKNDFYNIDITTPEYRSLIKVTPYLLELVAQSFKATQIKTGLKEGQTVEIINNTIIDIFKKFTEIVSRVPSQDEKDPQKKSTVFAVQQLVLRYYAQIIGSVHSCFPASQITSFIQDMITHIRNVPTDKKQTLIDKSKLRVILSLSSTECWTQPAEREALTDLFKDQLKAASKDPHLSNYFSITLASLFLSVRNEFIIDFINELSSAYDANEIHAAEGNIENHRTLSRLLLTVAFTFPHIFTNEKTDLFLRLMKSDLIGPQERLFTFAHYLRENQDVLSDCMTEADFKDKNRIIMTYLDLAIEAKTKESDAILNNQIYPSTADFSIIKKLLKLVPEEDIKRDFSEIPGPLIRCYAIYSTPNHQISDLGEMFTLLLPAGFKVSSMRATYALRNANGFEQVPHLFLETSEVGKQLRRFATSVSNITHLKIEEINQDTLAESYTTLINFCEENSIKELIPELLYGLVNIHDQYKNTIEQAFAIVKLCRLYQATEEPPTAEQQKYIPFIKATHDPKTHKPIFKIDQTSCRNMREILIALYKKAINLFIEGNYIYPPYAISIIQELKERCIFPGNITKPLGPILELESKVYDMSSSNDQVYFFFYRVQFTGNGFDESIRNKTMMYRTSGFEKADQFLKKLSRMFPGSQCFQSEDQYEKALKEIDPNNGMLILLTNAEPASATEVEDPFAMSPILSKPKFVVSFEKNRGLNCFKTQIPKNLPKFEGMRNEFQISRINQTYYFTEGEFPSCARRLNVITEKTIQRLLTPIQTACYMMTQQVEEIIILNQTFQYYHSHGTEVDGGQINAYRMKIKGTVEAAVNGGVSNYIDAFLTDEYITNNPNDKEYVDKLRQILGNLMVQVNVALDTIEPFCKDPNQKDQQESNKKSYAGLLEQMKDAGVEVNGI